MTTTRRRLWCVRRWIRRRKAQAVIASKRGGFAREEEFAVPKAHRAEIAHALTGGMVLQQHGIFHFGRHPHATPRAVLLEAHLIHGPELDGRLFRQGAKFFCAPTAWPDRPARSPAAAFGSERGPLTQPPSA